MTEANRRENIALALERADRELMDARLLHGAGSFAGSLGHAYYAVFQTARGLLLTLGEEPRTHRGLMTRLNLRFVRSGLMTPEVGNLLAVLHAQRQLATYDPAAVFTAAMAEQAIADASHFLDAGRTWLLAEGWL